jgi:hypothetical protein
VLADPSIRGRVKQLPLTFNVHLALSKPRPSWSAWKRWRKGSLTVHADRIEFIPRKGARLEASDVVGVRQPSRREERRKRNFAWYLETWIEVSYVDSGQPATIYLNDARFWYLGHYLDHKRMRLALESIVGHA